MKKSLVVLAGLALMGGMQSYAANQATIAANNYGTGAGVINYQATANGPISALPADAWIEVLVAGAGGAPTSLGAAFHPSEPGYFDNGVLLVPGVAAGATANFEVRAWTGASYDATDIKGSITFSQATGTWDDGVGSPNPPGPKSGPDLNMPTFTVQGVVPEPSTIALGILGAAALLIRRRK